MKIQRQPVLALQLAQQVEYCAWDGESRLVVGSSAIRSLGSQNYLWHRDALAHCHRNLVRELRGGGSLARRAHGPEQADRALQALARRRPVARGRFADLVADGEITD